MFNKFGNYTTFDKTEINQNHFVTVLNPPGMDYTTGAHGLDAYGRPGAEIDLLDRASPLLTPTDADGAHRGSPADIGAYEAF